MPKVTLLADEFSTYSFAFGRAMYNFTGGQPKEVPVPVAIAASKKKGNDGKPLFKVERMPEIVSPSQPNKNVAAPQKVLQNGDRRMTQLSFM